jgi:hypothetical protein
MSADSTACGDGEYTLVDVGGYRLAIHCLGEGSPTVVLETGLGAPSEYWAPIQQEIAGSPGFAGSIVPDEERATRHRLLLARAPIWSLTSASSYITPASQLPMYS